MSDHFSQFCIFRSARDRIKPARRKMCDITNFNRDSFTQDLNQIDWQPIIVWSPFFSLFRMSGIGSLVMSGDWRRWLVFGAKLSGIFAKAGHCNIDILLLKHCYCCNVPILFYLKYVFI